MPFPLSIVPSLTPQVYPVIPASVVYVSVEFKQVLFGPVIVGTGLGFIFNIMLSLTSTTLQAPVPVALTVSVTLPVSPPAGLYVGVIVVAFDMLPAPFSVHNTVPLVTEACETVYVLPSQISSSGPAFTEGPSSTVTCIVPSAEHCLVSVTL